MVAAIAGPDFYQFSKSFLGGIRSVKLSERERVRRAVGGDDALRVLAVLWWETNSGKRQFRGFLEDDGDTIYGINIKPIAKKAGLTRKKTGHVLNAVALSCIIANGEDEE